MAFLICQRPTLNHPLPHVQRILYLLLPRVQLFPGTCFYFMTGILCTCFYLVSSFFCTCFYFMTGILCTCFYLVSSFFCTCFYFMTGILCTCFYLVTSILSLLPAFTLSPTFSIPFFILDIFS